jgi:hypothetical protein
MFIGEYPRHPSSVTNQVEVMTKRKDSKMRETDRESRLMGRWTGIGFVIVLLGALIALLLLLGLG